MRNHHRVWFLVAALLLTWLNTIASGHLPDGQVFGVWQWPSSHLPTLDGDRRQGREACWPCALRSSPRWPPVR